MAKAKKKAAVVIRPRKAEREKYQEYLRLLGESKLVPVSLTEWVIRYRKKQEGLKQEEFEKVGAKV